jgi:hypothetical protein
MQNSRGERRRQPVSDESLRRPTGAVRYYRVSIRTMVKEGDKAPGFDLETDEGTRVKLSDYIGRNVVLFFYPKDNTSG